MHPPTVGTDGAPVGVAGRVAEEDKATPPQTTTPVETTKHAPPVAPRAPRPTGARAKLGRALRLLFVALEWPVRYIFGRDLFISYSRRDADEYAPALALALQEKRPKLSFYLDKWIAPPSGKLPRSLKRQLRWSSALVLVCTENSVRSEFVKEEIRTFSKLGRKVIPVSVNEAFFRLSEDADIWEQIGGATPERETEEAIGKAKPSANVVSRIENAVKFTLQDARLRRAVTVAVLVIGGAALFSYVTVSAARREADRQEEIGRVRRLANRSAFALNRKPELLLPALDYALEAAGRAEALGVRVLEADNALRSSLGLLPRSHGDRFFRDDAARQGFTREAVSLTADARHYAALSEQQQPAGQRTLKVRRTADGAEVAAVDCEGGCGGAALSNDTQRVALPFEDKDKSFVLVKETRAGGRRWELPLDEDTSLLRVALSPDGRYVAVGSWDSYSRVRESGGDMPDMDVALWEVEKRRQVGLLNTKTLLTLWSLSFSAGGDYLAVGGTGRNLDGRLVGCALIWRAGFTAPNLKADSVSGPEELLGGDNIDNVALSADGRYLSTSSGGTVLVWKRVNENSFRQVARVPWEQPASQLAFDPDGRQLITFAAGKDQGKVEAWDVAGYRELFSAKNDSSVDEFAFRPDAQSVTYLSNGELRTWKVRDGAESDEAVPAADASRARRSGEASFVVVQRGGGWAVWDVATGAELALPAESGFVDAESPVLSPGGKFIVRIMKRPGEERKEENEEESKSALVYQLEEGGYARKHQWQAEALQNYYSHGMAVGPAGDYVLIRTDMDDPPQLLDLKTGRDVTPGELKVVKHAFSFQFSPDGRYLAVLSQEGEEYGDEGNGNFVFVWDVKSGRVVKVVDSESWIRAYEFSPRGTYLAVGDRAGTIRMLRLADAALSTRSSDAPLTALAFSPDEALLATADEAGLLIVSALADGEEAAHLPYGGVVKRIRFSRDGRYLAASTYPEDSRFAEEPYHMLRVWSLQPRDLLGEACARLDRFPARKAQSYCSKL